MASQDKLRFAATHEWVRIREDGLLDVGISDFAQESLGDLVYMELPEKGRRCMAAEPCAVVESVKTASDIHCPVAGVIVEVNAELLRHPEYVNDDPWQHYLFTVQADDTAELENLMSEAEYYQGIKEN